MSTEIQNRVKLTTTHWNANPHGDALAVRKPAVVEVDAKFNEIRGQS